ncbi:MAG: isoprenyl transferase [Desulfobacteraceae bacterium]|nr:isoprenyl transferase [Desulfobacteraceae bacterium]
MNQQNTPAHVAIIMDGNGRWAQKRGMPRIMGHREGVRAVRDIVRAAPGAGAGVLTLYAFSTENWKRPVLEVQALMALLKTYLQSELAELAANGVSLRWLGERGKLPADVQKLLENAMAATAANSRLVLNLALNYGGRNEIVRAARELARRAKAGEIDPAAISEEIFGSCLDTAGLPDPDLVIRTGGESRLSNFLLWQASYAELYVTDTLWPDFTRDDLLAAIRYFQSRQRRFGETGEQVGR